MKRFIKTDNRYVQYVNSPLIPSDVNSYMISWNIGSSAVGAGLKVSAKRSDGAIIEDVGEVDSNGAATYTLKNNMYAVEGELILRLTAVQNDEVLTDKELVFDVAKAWDEATIEGDDRVPALSALIIQVNDALGETGEIKAKLDTVESGAQVNVIEAVKVNGVSLTVEEKAVDVTVPTKLSEFDNDAGFVADEGYVHTDNNYTAEDKATVSEALDTAYEALAIAGNPLQPVYFSSYTLLCHYANVGRLDSMRTAGQPVFIKQTGTPDLWISAINEEFTPYEYASDEEFIDVLNSQGFITVGYYEFRPIKVTEKVDLTAYSTTEEMNAAIDNKLVMYPTIDDTISNMNHALTDYSTTEEMNAAIAAAVGDVLGGAS